MAETWAAQYTKATALRNSQQSVSLATITTRKAGLRENHQSLGLSEITDCFLGDINQ